jgi:hypothetical protein
MRCERLRDCTHEEVVGVGDWTADSEELHQIMKLAVNVAAYLKIVSVDQMLEEEDIP